MIESIRGRVAARGPDWVVLDLGAVSVRLNTTTATLADLGEPGAHANLLTHLYVREDLMVLYGFGTHEERELFLRLLGVTGVGPRAAQMMLSALSPGSLRAAIENESVDALVRVPGVGRKTAQRVILELKGKLAPSSSTAAPARTGHDDDLVSVLTGLGYSAAAAAEALGSVPPKEGLSDEDRLRAALRHFAAP